METSGSGGYPAGGVRRRVLRAPGDAAEGGAARQRHDQRLPSVAERRPREHNEGTAAARLARITNNTEVLIASLIQI